MGQPRSNNEFESGYVEGYLVGKAEVYCEQVRTGAKLGNYILD